VAHALRQRPLGQHHLQLAAADRVGAHGFRQHGDPVSVLGHGLEQREVEAGQARLQLDLAHLVIGAVQFPALARLVLAHRHGHVLDQVFRTLRAAGALQVLGAGHQQFLDLAEAAHDQAAVVIELGAHAQGHVVALVDDVHAAVVDVQLQADLGVLVQEPRQDPGQLHLRHRHRHADPHHTAWLGREAIDHFARGLGFGQHGLGVAMHAHAHVGDRETARGALQQAHAHVGFQLADAPAQARLGNAQRAFGRGEAAMVHDHGEVIEVIEVLHGAIPNLERFTLFNHPHPAGTTKSDQIGLNSFPRPRGWLRRCARCRPCTGAAPRAPGCCRRPAGSFPSPRSGSGPRPRPNR